MEGLQDYAPPPRAPDSEGGVHAAAGLGGWAHAGLGGRWVPAFLQPV